MGLRNGLAAMALIGALAAPGPLMAQVNPPPAAIAQGIEADFLVHFWCGQVFAHESIRQEALGDTTRTDHYALLMLGMGSDAPGRFLAAGHSEIQRDILIRFYRITLETMPANHPDAYRDALGACETAFSRGTAPMIAEPAEPDVPGLAEGVAAYKARDYETALHLLRPLAEAGNAEAQFHMGQMYAMAQGVERNTPEALEWYKRAGGQKHVDALIQAAILLLADRDIPPNGFLAAGMLATAAEMDSAYAQYLLADILITGEAGAPIDYFRAQQYLHRAAEAGHMFSQVALGELYDTGFILAQDHAEAARWYRRASNQFPGGVASARLAVLYIHGRGVPQDFEEAERLIGDSSSNLMVSVRELLEQVRSGN